MYSQRGNAPVCVWKQDSQQSSGSLKNVFKTGPFSLRVYTHSSGKSCPDSLSRAPDTSGSILVRYNRKSCYLQPNNMGKQGAQTWHFPSVVLCALSQIFQVDWWTLLGAACPAPLEGTTRRKKGQWGRQSPLCTCSPCRTSCQTSRGWWNGAISSTWVLRHSCVENSTSGEYNTVLCAQACCNKLVMREFSHQWHNIVFEYII